MSVLPVREMVLYKHGVGFFVRGGLTHSENVALTFREDEINDVLKSLAVFDRAGGKILGLHYQTPMDKSHRLASSSIRLSDTKALRDLLRDLRGRRVKIVFETSLGTPDIVIGRVMGIDEPQFDHEKAVVLVRTENSEIRAFELRAFRSLSLEDELSNQDLLYFLQSSMSEDARRTVHIRLSEGEQHDLFVSYVAPSPTWRVSYRIVAEADESGETGKALLQGWGLFDNRLEEDLNDVKVTLVAGQPISFVYDLYTSKIPQRPVVKDETRIAPGPVEFEGQPAPPAAAKPAPSRQRLGAFADADADQIRFGRAEIQVSQMAAPDKADFAAATTSAEGAEAGEFFQYIVTAPVSVKRGESALVPIIGKEVSYNRELLYNKAKLPNHPVASLRFDNHTGLTLERGPVTIVEDSDYKGEAIVPFTKDGNQVYLAYAVELGVKITEKTENSTQVHGLEIEGRFLVYQEFVIYEVAYILENNTPQGHVITIEASISDGFELFDSPPPQVETAKERRWRVEVPAHSTTTFTHKERFLQRRRQELRQLSYDSLDRFMRNRWLDQNTLDQLAEMLDYFAAIEQAKTQSAALHTERKAIHEKQEQIRANMQALQTSGPEAAFRKKLLSQLEDAQNRLGQIEATLEALNDQMNQADARIAAFLSSLRPGNGA